MVPGKKRALFTSNWEIRWILWTNEKNLLFGKKIFLSLIETMLRPSVYSTRNSPRGFGKWRLLPICSVFSSEVGGAHLPICLLRSLAHWAPRCHGPSHRVWRNKIPLTSDTGSPQAANLFSFRGPLPLRSPFRMQEILPVHPPRVMRQTTIRFSFI